MNRLHSELTTWGVLAMIPGRLGWHIVDFLNPSPKQCLELLSLLCTDEGFITLVARGLPNALAEKKCHLKPDG